MTELANGIGQGQDTPLSSPGLTSSSQSTAPVSQGVSQSNDERVFKQSEVNEIVKRAKYGAVEDFKRLQSEQPDYFQQKHGNNNQVDQQQNRNVNAESEIRRLAAEEAQRLRDEWVKESRSQYETAQAHQIVQNFWDKVNPARTKYQDFDSALGAVDLRNYPDVVGILSNSIDNADDVLYHLLKNEVKMAELQRFANENRHHLAISQTKSLAQSLKDNDAASKVKLPNEPLSQVRPSNTGTDNGAMSVKDYRAKYRG